MCCPKCRLNRSKCDKSRSSILTFRSFAEGVKTTTGIEEGHFTNSEWDNNFSKRKTPPVSIVHLTWRLIYLLYCLSASVSNAYHYLSNGKYHFCIYLTQWCLWTQTLYSIVFAAYLLIRWKEARLSKNDNLSKLVTCGESELRPDACKNHAQEELERFTPILNADIGTDEDWPSALSTPFKQPLKPKSVANKRSINADIIKFHSIPEKCSNSKNSAGSSAGLLMFKFLESIIWILFNVVSAVAIFVTLGYWVTVYPTESKSKGINFQTFISHGFNGVFALVDVIIVALPVRIPHFIYSLTFGLIYIGFSVLYEVSGGTYLKPERPYIYSYLNWRERPYWAMLSCFVGILVILILHMVLYLLYVLRLFVVPRCLLCSKKWRRVQGFNEAVAVTDDNSLRLESHVQTIL